MTDNYITEITSALIRLTEEVKVLRRDMPTKEEVLNLWNLRQDMVTKENLEPLIGSAARQERLLVELRTMDKPAHPPMELQERVNTIARKLLDRIENLEKAPRYDITQLEHRMDELDRQHADMLFMLRDHDKRYRELHEAVLNLQRLWSLRSTENGETRTRPDTGASRTPETQAQKDLRGYEEQLAKGWVELDVELHQKLTTAAEQSTGGSGSQPATPAPESSGTEQPCEHPRLNEDGICRTCGSDQRRG